MSKELLVKQGLEPEHQDTLEAAGLPLATVLMWLIQAGTSAPQVVAIIKALIAAFKNPSVAPPATVAGNELMKLGLTSEVVQSMSATGLDLTSILNMIKLISDKAPQIIAVLNEIVTVLNRLFPSPVPPAPVP